MKLGYTQLERRGGHQGRLVSGATSLNDRWIWMLLGTPHCDGRYAVDHAHQFL
jgi:hypothetical protein